MDWAVADRPIVGARTLPDHLVDEPLRPEDGIENEFQVVARGRVAMEVEGSLWDEDAMELDQAHGHHCEVGQNVRFPQQLPHGLQGVGHPRGAVGQQVEVGVFGFLVPGPGVVERFDLGL